MNVDRRPLEDGASEVAVLLLESGLAERAAKRVGGSCDMRTFGRGDGSCGTRAFVLDDRSCDIRTLDLGGISGEPVEGKEVVDAEGVAINVLDRCRPREAGVGVPCDTGEPPASSPPPVKPLLLAKSPSGSSVDALWRMRTVSSDARASGPDC